MISLNKVLAVVAVSISAVAGVQAQAAQPAAGIHPLFEDLSYAGSSTVNRADVQAQARQAIQNHAFRDDVSAYSEQAAASQGSALSRAQVHAEAVDAMKNDRLSVGE
ncbi:hypothetical protein E9531_10790 [Lampropedia puyangensis]|uniref:DUF4148 domain-containing protein n=1 Tax=Lampropedia puyangensis TaxID=1330072 RepID=A0A4V4GR88_9BURK|nr:hypothetical protein [Lampropedia puyangensis]THU00246.1 hypothetical protein E9531_10790 [Lampropedia puyangensis]